MNETSKPVSSCIRVNSQSSIRIQDGDTVFYFDPYNIDGKPHDADAVFFTHPHYDHFSPEDIDKVSNPDTILVMPKSMALLSEVKNTLKFSRILNKDNPVLDRSGGMDPGAVAHICDREVEAVIAYNFGDNYHKKQYEWLGYIVTLGGKRIYISGDTDATDEAKAVKCDIAIIPVGGTFTMNPQQAAELINAIRPEIAVPTHFGTIVGDRKDGETFRSLVNEHTKVLDLEEFLENCAENGQQIHEAAVAQGAGDEKLDIDDDAIKRAAQHKNKNTEKKSDE